MQSASGSGPSDADADADDMSLLEIEAAVQRALLGRHAAVQLAATNTPAFIKYDPARHSASSNSGRIIRLSETPFDPLVPPKFKSKRVPRPGQSPPAPVMSSPPRPPSRKDQDDWKVPPCVSRWNNPKGYTIPLDKRQRASSYGEEVRVSDNFAMMVEALYVAERKARESVRMQRDVWKEMRARLMERREQELRRLARSACAERAATAAAPAAPPVSAGEYKQSEEKQSVSDIRGADADEKVTKTQEAPARATGKRERPVELDEPEQGDDDPFDLDQFMAQVMEADEH